MKNFTHQHFDSIRIESDSTLLLEYSEPDQGGTRLLHRFRIFHNKVIEVEIGYLHDADFEKKRIPIQEVPQRIFQDALDWITQQIQCATSDRLVQILNDFREIISTGALGRG